LLAVLARIDGQRQPSVRIRNREALCREGFAEPGHLPVPVFEHVVEHVHLVTGTIEQVSNRARERRDRLSRVTCVWDICCASHATRSSKSRVYGEPARAHGTASYRSPQPGQ
jgi:hypothetical protein